MYLLEVCSLNNKGLTEEQFLERLEELQPQLNFKMEGYINSSKPAIFTCNDCGYVTKRTRAKSIWFTKACKGCVGGDFKNNNKGLLQIIEGNGCKLIQGEYETEATPLLIKFKCGHEDTSSWAQLRPKFKLGLQECRRCGNQKANNKRKLKEDKIQERLNSHPYGKFTATSFLKKENSEYRLTVKCLCCGKEEEDVSYHSFMKRKSGCSCSGFHDQLSSGERLLGLLLDDISVRYIRQKHFSEAGISMFYDFFLPDYNILIEYDGQQHERGDAHIKDKFKDQYAADNEYTLYRISHKVSIFSVIKEIDAKHSLLNSKGKSTYTEDDTDGVEFDF